MLAQTKLRYDQSRWNLVAAVRAALGCHDTALQGLAQLPREHTARGTPPVHRALVEVRKGESSGPSIRSLEAMNLQVRRAWRHGPAHAAFKVAFQQFVDEWLLPQFECDCWVSPATLRVVLPGGIRPSRPHCDADYGYDASEINYWVPLTYVHGANSMWVESAPGLADFAPIEAAPGQVVRFYGNRCHHFTLANDSDAVRVTFDFRVLPRHLASDAHHGDEAVLRKQYTLHEWDGVKHAAVVRST